MDLKMNLDIHTGVQTAFFLAIFGVALSLLLGVKSIRAGQRLQYFRKRRDLIVRGWKLIFTAVGLSLAALFLGRFAEPAAYQIFPPSPTVTQTATITLTPTISLTPTITSTPTITDTPSVTNTPSIPEEIAIQFTSVVTPNPDAIFSPIQFTKQLGEDQFPIETATEFQNPVGNLIGFFSYDKMLQGAQWTAVWLRLADGKMLCYESFPWEGSTGGYDTTECNPPSSEWQPGEYEVQIFVGSQWNVSSRFVVTGTPPTATVTPTPSRTPTATFTITSTRTVTSTVTPKPPTLTPTPRPTGTATRTPLPTATPRPTRTPAPTSTKTPSRTPRITDTRWPTP